MMNSRTNLYVTFSVILFVGGIIFFYSTSSKSIPQSQVIKAGDGALPKAECDLFADKLHSLIKKIRVGEYFSQAEEAFYFGEEGVNNIGRSLSKHNKHYTRNKCGMLGQIVIDKLHPVLSGYDVYEYSFGKAKIVGCTDGILRGGGGHRILTVIFRDTNHKKKDVVLIFNLYIPQDEPGNFYIRLHLSFLNGIPLWEVLGFSRHERIWGEFYPPQ